MPRTSPSGWASATSSGAGTPTRALSVNAARALLSGPTLHQTRALQSLTMAIPTGKGRRQVPIIDSTGLDERGHDAAEIRRADRRPDGALCGGGPGGRHPAALTQSSRRA